MAMHSPSLHHIRSVNQVSHVAQHGDHLKSLARTWVRPTGVRHQVAHGHERAADQCSSAFMS